MSSYYTTAQLEAQRKEKLRKDLNDTVQKLRDQMRVKHENSVQVASSSNLSLSVFAVDDMVGGYSGNNIVNAVNLQNSNTQTSPERDELDFSALLIGQRNTPTKLEAELDSWLIKIEERPIVNARDEEDRKRLLSEVAKITDSSSMDIEDKVKMVRMRVMSYLQGGIRLTENDLERINASFYEYCVLCEMLEMKPTERYPYRIEQEINRMTAILESRREEEYILEVIENVMNELGCHLKDDAVLDHVVGQVFAIDGNPLCDVFVGLDGSGIMIEPVGKERNGSLEQKRQIENSANTVCSMYETIETKAAAYGVILKRVYADPICVEKMCIQSDLREHTTDRRKRNAVIQKQRALNPEG